VTAAGVYLGHAGAFQPAQDAQFGLRVAQAVEDHHAQEAFGIELAVGPQDAAEGIMEAQFLPQGGEHPGVAHRQGGGEGDVAGALFQGGFAGGAQQAVEQGIGLAGAQGFQTAQGGDDPLAGDPLVVTEGFDEFDVLPGAGGGDLHEHVATVGGM
jgi:hypothetical protein